MKSGKYWSFQDDETRIKFKWKQNQIVTNNTNSCGDYRPAYCRLLAKLQLVILHHLFDINLDADSALSNGDYWSPWTTTRELGAYCLMYQCVVLSYYTRSMSLRSEAAAAHLTLILTSDILGNYMEALLLNDIFMCRLLHIRFRLYIYTVA